MLTGKHVGKLTCQKHATINGTQKLRYTSFRKNRILAIWLSGQGYCCKGRQKPVHDFFKPKTCLFVCLVSGINADASRSCARVYVKIHNFQVFSYRQHPDYPDDESTNSK